MGLLDYRDHIRSYARGVRDGLYDTDITGKQTRRYLEILLNIASNDAGYAYPPSDHARNTVINTYNQLFVWRALLTNAESASLDIALDRAVRVLRNI